MLIEKCLPYLPSDWWDPMKKQVQLIPLSMSDVKYLQLKMQMSGFFNQETKRIVRVQNPFLYFQFQLRYEESKTKGPVCIKELFHDTSEANINSIVKTNLDWRRSQRVKFGRGVSFSPSAEYANRYSTLSNSVDRAMIVADVIVGETWPGEEGCQLPPNGFDTTTGNGGNVYVKYYDNEFYPKYIIYYGSASPLHSAWDPQTAGISYGTDRHLINRDSIRSYSLYDVCYDGDIYPQ